MPYFNNCQTIEDVKSKYKDLCFKLHPDVSGSDTTEEFKRMANEYEAAFEALKNKRRNVEGEIYEKENAETPQEYADIIAKLMMLPGLVVEIIGTFIWVSGDSKPNKDGLKALGFRYHSKKIMWYKAPADYVKKSRKSFTMDEVRTMFDNNGTYKSATPGALPG